MDEPVEIPPWMKWLIILLGFALTLAVLAGLIFYIMGLIVSSGVELHSSTPAT